MTDIKKIASDTIQTEIDGLKKLHLTINDDWVKAIEALKKTSGRVIVSGIGKSGHIARKIAATLASTGCLSQFVHPSEAAHGDLGMITKEDALLILSWSGESLELKPLINYSRRFGVLLIGLTANKNSALGNTADITIELPKATEAGSLALAPTTSTTIQLVAGDALAISLLEMKGFNKDNFRDFHPGGALSAQLKIVRDIMHSQLPLCEKKTKMSEVLLKISAGAFGCVGVIDEQGFLCGIITDGDLRRHIEDNLFGKNAENVMTANPKTINPDMLASSALEIMNREKITALFAVENNRPIGVIHVHDILRQGVI